MEKKDEITENIEHSDKSDKIEEAREPLEDIESLKKEHVELKDKYLRLYADFENYKRIVAKDKERLINYANEFIAKELLSVIDHLELAIQHSSENAVSNSIAEGVKMTLKELRGILEKFGLTEAPAFGMPFDPSMHEAMAEVETEDVEERTVVKEFRKGYIFKDRVLRAALVAVSKKPSQKIKIETEEEQ